MQIYRGFSALSDFRQDKLLKTLQAINPKISGVQASYIHFADTAGKLSPTEDQAVTQLLTYGIDSDVAADEGELFLIVPRPGTISPWSSKATDIARNSGLENIKRLERGIACYVNASAKLEREQIGNVLHDRMTETVLFSIDQAKILFKQSKPQPLAEIKILGNSGKATLARANIALGLALTTAEIDYVYDAYTAIQRNPTDTELMMFAVVNSEHCRHKIFNADWLIDGVKQPKSLFKMIRNTYEKSGQNVLSAYSDNAAVITGASGGRFFADPVTKQYSYHKEQIHIVIKVETHNHPTAIAPNPGAATGIGGEIRDEAATGRGAKTKMGLSGFSVSNLEIPGSIRPWEKKYGKPDRIVSALDIMLEAPIGGASFANEFGRPNLAGYFRTLQEESCKEMWGYHKPIMIAGGLGNIRDEHVAKGAIPADAPIIVLGGPAMLIGLGGGAASSMQSGSSAENLDFASVQRANAEMERRCQEVIDACWALGEDNPITSIHDVGAGGLSNALPELVHDSNKGAHFELRDIPSAEDNLSPMQIWCNEAQERYVLAIQEDQLQRFEALCKRERCPFAVVGKATNEERLVVHDNLHDNTPIDIPMSVLFGTPPKMTREFTPSKSKLPGFDTSKLNLADAIERVLQIPSVGSKKFLITIGDRTVGGLVTRDQMVGPWQVPVSDVAVAASAFDTNHGEAMAMGERTPLALINAPASARIAIGETITNLLASDIQNISDIKLSANWMAASGHKGEDEKLYNAVKAVGEEFCPAVGLTIPVGKDSLSMRTTWQDAGKTKSVASPLSLVISGFSPVFDISKTYTPLLSSNENTVLIAIDLGTGQNRLGGSALAQAYNAIGNQTPDITPELLTKFFTVITELKKRGLVLAYHDRSDGGLITTLLEMAFASRSGLKINLDKDDEDTLATLFNEELGAVIQVDKGDCGNVMEQLENALGPCARIVGTATTNQAVIIQKANEILYKSTRVQLEEWWGNTSYQIQRLRDDPESADQEYRTISDAKNPGLSAKVPYSIQRKTYKTKPKVAIFREQGVNGHIEMAAVFDAVGFTSVDVHLHDIIEGVIDLKEFSGLVVCGGFSYGDVLGAGEGWAKSILLDPGLRQQFSDFFERKNTFSLGVCNGCQMLSALKEIIPGAEAWPQFLKNKSEQFEARLATVQVNQSPSIFFKGMSEARLLVPVAHGEGRVVFGTSQHKKQVWNQNMVALQYVDNHHKTTEEYPANPNGSPDGITSLTTPDGRATILMPHPERAFMTRQLSWHPEDWGADSPWLQMFQNARDWLEATSS